MLGVAIIGGLLLAGFFAPLPYSSLAIDPQHAFEPPTLRHIFGTDEVGADLFTRTVRAAAVDLPLALGGTLISVLIGIPLGLVMSMRSPWSERAMRALDIFQGLPLLVIALSLTALGGGKPYLVVFAIALFGVPLFIRLMRSRLLVLRESGFVDSARVSGASEMRLLFRHLLPNLRSEIVTQTSLTLAISILVVAALSFLGVGVPPPTPSWGVMIRQAVEGIAAGQWWLLVFPGSAIFICVWSANMIADDLRARRRG